MRKISFLFLLMFATVGLYSQNYNISFAATGASTTITSIEVNNLTKNTTLTLNNGDILHLGSLGTENIDVSVDYFQVFPNPMLDKSEISFYAKQSGIGKIIVCEMTGRNILQVEKDFSKGLQKCHLSGLKQGVYFISIIGNGYSYTSKLISNNTAQPESKLVFIGDINSANPAVNPKSTATTIDMDYTNGDILLFKGISVYKGINGIYKTIVTDIPTSSKTITFDFVQCKDNDNNNYVVVKIGTQLWMAENLKTTKYNDNNPIPLVSDTTVWANTLTPAYCWYANDVIANKDVYGALYNWHAVNTTKLCPAAWHVATDAEWTTLIGYLGGSTSAMGKMKETGLLHWNSPNYAATNESGFTALPGGSRTIGGIYNGLGNYGSWWSSSAEGIYDSWSRMVNNLSVNSVSMTNENGFSVRCIKD
jgi:uncharacterized protein (TIGR02145 family)